MHRDVIIVSGVTSGRRCGIFDYSERLVDGLQQAGCNAALLNLNDWGAIGTARNLVRFLRFSGILHLQFPSQGFGKKVGPGLLLPAAVCAKRFVTFHEFSRMSWKGKARCIPALLMADRIIVTNAAEAEAICTLRPSLSDKVSTIPIGSNVPECLGTGTGHRAVGFFGLISDKPSVRMFLEIVAKAGLAKQSVIIGHADQTDARTAALLDRARACGVELALGLSKEEAAARLAGLDVALLPFEDGISERRGSALAAMLNGAIVVTTVPHPEAAGLFENICISADSVDELVQATRRAVTEPQRYAPMIERAKTYAKGCSWEAIAHHHLNLYVQVSGSEDLTR